MPTLEHPQFILDTLNMSIADFIGKYFPGIDVYTNPMQQDYDSPCFYINYIGDQDNKEQIDDTSTQNLNLEITYEEPHNIPNLFDKYREVAQTINDNIEHNLTYNLRDPDNINTIIKEIPLHVHDKRMACDLNAMHYKFKLSLRLRAIKEEVDKIEKIKWEISAKN